MRTTLTPILLLLLIARPAMAEDRPRPFALHIVDSQSNRGVPLVQVKTVSSLRLWTDSAGYIAIDDPALLGRKVFFEITSHGYEFPADGFGMHGVRLDVTPGGEATLKINRINIAERLYRITGEGIYRDSILLGKHAPTAEPLLNGEVVGQDSTLNAIYQGKLWWFWGDTLRQSYPLGQFSMSGATSDLPANGGLDPAVGVNLKYFVDETGFSRPMVPPTGSELHWIDGVVTLKDDQDRERMIATLLRLKSLSEFVGREVVAWDDKKALFQTLAPLDLQSPYHLCGHPFLHSVDGVEYFYCGECFPNLRVKANWKNVADPGAFEAYMPAADANGKTTWAWRSNVPAADYEQMEKRIRSGKAPSAEIPFRLEDIDSGRFVQAHHGSVCWNKFRRKWLMITAEHGGKSSFLGEIWYAEADAPEGPWHAAKKILTHDRYSFYNPVQHPFFDQQEGRFIYFEGTYTASFSRESDFTPRYEYNQLMYRLDLSDPKLKLSPRK